MKLSDTVNDAITERFRQHRPQSFEAKIRLVMSCDAISPYPDYRQARSLLSQRGTLARKARRQLSEARLIAQEERAIQYRDRRPDLFD